MCNIIERLCKNENLIILNWFKLNLIECQEIIFGRTRQALHSYKLNNILNIAIEKYRDVSKDRKLKIIK